MTIQVSHPSGTVTFLFADVEGSTRLWAVDSDAMSASLRVHESILRAAIESRGGYVFSTAGDSFAAAFGRASDAIAAAAAAQDALANTEWPGPSLRVRIGVHLGEAEERGGDYFGPVVNTTARVEAAGHGGQTLITEAVRVAARATAITDLGVHRLRDVDEPVHLHQLGDTVFPPLRVEASRPRSNLPVRPTRLIGRSAEVAEARRLFAGHRLVTIAGVGGSGKTRLAIAIGEEECSRRLGGVWFADLTAVMNGDDVPAAIASAIGLQLTEGDPTVQVTTYLTDKKALVVIDNCEHLIDACAAFSEAFLAVAGQANLLATSREAIDVDGERVMHLPSLTATATGSVADTPAVQLFVERAQSSDPSFHLDTDNAPIIAAICERLDGMPLAIELAAARMTVMSPAELLAGLGDRFRLLSGGRRQAVAQRVRQREHPLADGHMQQDVIDELRRAGSHAPTAAARAKPPALAGKGHQCLGVTAVALKTCEALGPDSAVQEAAELLLEERGEAGGIGAGSGGEKRLQVFAHHLMEDGAFGLAGGIPQGGHGGAAFVAGTGLASHEPRAWQSRALAASLRVGSRRDPERRRGLPDAHLYSSAGRISRRPSCGHLTRPN